MSWSITLIFWTGLFSTGAVQTATESESIFKSIDWLFNQDSSGLPVENVDGLLTAMTAEEAKKFVNVITTNVKNYVEYRTDFCRTYENLCISGNTLRLKNSETSANSVIFEIKRTLDPDLEFAFKIFKDCSAERLTTKSVQC